MQRNSIIESNDAISAEQVIGHVSTKDEEYAAELLVPAFFLEKSFSEETAHYPNFTKGLFFGFLFSACIWAMIALVFSLFI